MEIFLEIYTNTKQQKIYLNDKNEKFHLAILTSKSYYLYYKFRNTGKFMPFFVNLQLGTHIQRTIQWTGTASFRNINVFFLILLRSTARQGALFGRRDSHQ